MKWQLLVQASKNLIMRIDDYKGIEVQGKWVMMLDELPAFVREKLPEETLNKYFPDFGYRIQLAKDAGALGIINILSDVNEFEIWKEYAKRSHEFYTLPKIGNLNYNKLLTLIVVDSLVMDYLFKGQKLLVQMNRTNTLNLLS